MVVAQADAIASGEGGLEAAIQHYSSWLEQHGSEPSSAPAWFNRGVLLSGQGRRDEAADSYRTALAVAPAFWQAAANLANYHEWRGDPDQAILALENTLSNVVSAEGVVFFHNHLGRLQESRRQFDRALLHYQTSLDVNPDQPDTLQHLFYLRQKICAWPLTITPIPLSVDQFAARLGTLSAMAYFDDVGLVYRACRAWYERFLEKEKPQILPPAPAYQHQRKRIGYVSGDFRMHAVGFLIAELFERHDRNFFEVIGFDFSADDKSHWRQRMIRGMDQCFALHDLSDAEAANVIRQQEIDILVDLMGPTANSRPGIFMRKPAPIQVSYLGFLGPNAIPQIDYLICDDYVIPAGAEDGYGAQLIRLPFYQINNSLRTLGPIPDRASQGLPENAFVYCAINNSYKITAELFDRWMQILKAVEGSVLWLLEENDFVKNRLLREGAKYGIGQHRLIFAKPVPPHEYLARFACADLFLDTSPYNAGVTAADALWAGLPVLTCPGKTFTSRMAGSLLNRLGLGEFICGTWFEYVQRAIYFARSGAAKRLLEQKKIRDSSVFDSQSFVRHLEDAFKELAG